MTVEHEKELRAKAPRRSKLQIAEDLEREAKIIRAEALEKAASKQNRWIRRAIYVRNWLTRNEFHAAAKQVQAQIKALTKEHAAKDGVTQIEIDSYAEQPDEAGTDSAALTEPGSTTA